MSNSEGQSIYIDGTEYTLGEQLGSGKEGSVYHLKGSNTDVVKIFEEQYRATKGDKVRAMIANPPRDPTHKQQGLRSIIWPEKIVRSTDSRVFIGYRMPYKDLSEVKNAFQYAMQNLAWNRSTEKERYTTALNLAIMVHAIHKQGHAIGDFNHDNILIDDGYISLIDCDSFDISGGQERYPGETFLPRYAPPEKRGKTLQKVQQADRFGLGVHIFQLLMEGNHPFLATGPDAVDGDWGVQIRGNPFPFTDPDARVSPHDGINPSFEELPSTIQSTFSDCFEAGKTDGRHRPTPTEWITVLSDLSNVSGEISVEEDSDTESGSTSSHPSSGADRPNGPSANKSPNKTRTAGTRSNHRNSRRTRTHSTPSPPDKPLPTSIKQIGNYVDRVVREVKRLGFYIAALLFVLVVGYLFISVA